MTMKIGDGERKGIKAAIEVGRQVGFGNLIGHLCSAWAEALMRDYNMTEKDSLAMSGGRTGYPVKMHRDIIDRGEWDETGERYKQRSEP